LDAAGTVTGRLPYVTTPGEYATMYVRTMRRTLTEVTLDLWGGEIMMLDHLNLSSKPVAAHPVYTGQDLIEWTLTKVFGSGTVTSTDDTADAYLTVKPKRVTIDPGGDYFTLTESDMSSRGVRLLDLWGV